MVFGVKLVARLMSEYDRGTGCGKTARPGLWRRLRATGVPTPEALIRFAGKELEPGPIFYIFHYN